MKDFPRDDFLASLFQAKKVLANIDLHSLPSIAIDQPGFGNDLPTIPAIYFIFGTSREPLYIGRAMNLRKRWYQTVPEHHRLEDALNLSCASLRWLEVPRTDIGLIEILMIQIYVPPWNSHSSPNPGGLPLTRYDRNAIAGFRKVRMW